MCCHRLLRGFDPHVNAHHERFTRRAECKHAVSEPAGKHGEVTGNYMLNKSNLNPPEDRGLSR